MNQLCVLVDESSKEVTAGSPDMSLRSVAFLTEEPISGAQFILHQVFSVTRGSNGGTQLIKCVGFEVSKTQVRF